MDGAVGEWIQEWLTQAKQQAQHGHRSFWLLLCSLAYFPPCKLVVCWSLHNFILSSILCTIIDRSSPQLVSCYYHYHQSIIIRSSCLLLSLLLLGHRCLSILFSQVIVPAPRRHRSFSGASIHNIQSWELSTGRVQHYWILHLACRKIPICEKSMKRFQEIEPANKCDLLYRSWRLEPPPPPPVNFFFGRTW